MTSRTVRLVTGVAVVAAGLGAPAARAEDPAPTGLPCRTAEVWTTGARVVTVLSGGPLAAPGSAVSMRCSLHEWNAGHSDPAVYSISSEPTANVTAVGPEVIAFGDRSAATVCTEATVGATTWYWAPDGWTTDPGAACGDVWSVAPEPVADLVRTLVEITVCLVQVTNPLGLTVVPRSTCDTVGTLDRYLAEHVYPVLDAVTCGTLVALAPAVNGLGRPDLVAVDPAQGDTSLLGEPFWDCPPYSSG